MIEFTLADLEGLVGQWLWPLFRIASFLAAAPIIGARVVSARIRIVLAILLTVLVAPNLESLPAFDGLLQLNGDNGFFVGDKLSQADLAVWDIVDSMLVWITGANLNNHPRLQKFYDAIKARPGIAAYLDSDKRPEG